MPHLFNQQEIQKVSDDLKVFLNAVKGPIDKLDYINETLPILEKEGFIEIKYRRQNIDMITEVENAVILQMDKAEQKQLSILLYLSPAVCMIYVDILFLQQILFRLFKNMLEASERKSVISVYVTDTDDKCMIEVLNQKNHTSQNEPDDYFKRYRINNPLYNEESAEGSLLLVYKNMIEDMAGDFSCSFIDTKQLYFRLKFPLV